MTVGGEEARGLDVNRLPEDEGNDATALSSPNSGVSSFQMDFCISNSNGSGSGRNKREREGEAERASDDDENGSTRKKLRLSKEQSAFLEESFKEHTTLNPVSSTTHLSLGLFSIFTVCHYVRYIKPLFPLTSCAEAKTCSGKTVKSSSSSSRSLVPEQKGQVD